MSSNSSDKVKVLLVGRIDTVHAATLVCQRLHTLHTSKAGPFDVVFASCGDSDALTTLTDWYGSKQQQSAQTSSRGGNTATSSCVVPLYLQDTGVTAAAVTAVYAAAAKASSTPATATSASDDDDDDNSNGKDTMVASPSCCLLAPNLWVLRTSQTSNNEDGDIVTTPPQHNNDDPAAGIWNLPIRSGLSLVVASVPPLFREDAATAAGDLQSSLGHVSYTGCDILLSTEWPQGIDALVPPTTATPAATATTVVSLKPPSISFDVAHVALQARARYHVAMVAPVSSTVNNPNEGEGAPSIPTTTSSPFVQTPLFRHALATTSTISTAHTGRFLAVSAVPTTAAASTAVKGNKSIKWVHAVGIVPLHHGSNSSVVDSTKAVARCPYTDAAYPVDDHGGNGTGTLRSMGLSDAAARRILHDDRHHKSNMAGTDRWAKRSRHDKNDDSAMVDPENCVLFVYGLHQDVTGRLSDSSNRNGSDALIQRALPGCVAVRRPPGAGGQHTSAFLFAEFPTHEAARTCLEASGGSVTVTGVPLTVKWATTNTRGNHNNHSVGRPEKRQRLTEDQARDSSTVYFKLAPSSSKIDRETLSVPGTSEALRLWTEQTLERALAGEDAKEEDIVKAADEPALQVKVRLPGGCSTVEEGGTSDATAAAPSPKLFGFLDFASHAAASMVLATLTGSTDGGRILDEQQTKYVETNRHPPKDDTADAMPILGPQLGVYLHWGLPESSGMGKDRNVIQDETAGFRFERKHFPADARTDCWFCLASSSCERHLIAGVYDSCYAALPKGPVHPGHVLLVPVQHGSRGALATRAVAQEMEGLKAKLRSHARDVYDSDLFVFERAIQTRGGYHTHVQCIPVPRDRGIKLQATMMAQARRLGLALREINSDVAVQAVLGGAEDDEEEAAGYFYAELPCLGAAPKRFLHQARIGGGSRNNQSTAVPLQFGREVLAAVLEKPELAHWKSCVVKQEEEAVMATKFRESFAKYTE